MKKSQLRKIIRESIKGLLTEQTSAECGQINALSQNNTTFAGCCEMGYFGQPPGTPTFNNPNNINNPDCKAIQNQAMQINPDFYNCCDPNFGTRSDLNRCDTPIGSYDTSPSGPLPDHNPDWGLGCWFCHPEGSIGQNCMVISVPMDQGQAYLAYTNGTSGLYNTMQLCNADPTTKCGEAQHTNEVECYKCENGYPVGNMFPGSCPPGWTPAASFNQKGCKYKGGGIPTSPDLTSKMKPNQGDMKRAIREMKRRINISKR